MCSRAGGFRASLARPGGNLTGVLQYEASVVGKWLAMLKEIATFTNTIGITRLSRCSAAVAGVVCARITSGWVATNSFASGSYLLLLLPAKRVSM